MKIFIASTGRCGTRFFWDMFRKFTKIPSFHEQKPKCVNVVSYEMNNLPQKKWSPHTKKVFETKIRNISKTAEKTGTYMDSSHMFIKSFGPHIFDLFDDIRVIYLWRDLPSLLASYSYRAKRNVWPLDFQLRPEWKNNILKIKDGNSIGFYPTVAFNYFEVLARFKAWEHRFSKTYEFPFRDLNNPERWRDMMERLEIDAAPIKHIPQDADHHQSIFSENSRTKAIEHVSQNWDLPDEYERDGSGFRFRRDMRGDE